jgi:hypothetical protein
MIDAQPQNTITTATTNNNNNNQASKQFQESNESLSDSLSIENINQINCDEENAINEPNILINHQPLIFSNTTATNNFEFLLNKTNNQQQELNNLISASSSSSNAEETVKKIDINNNNNKSSDQSVYQNTNQIITSKFFNI